MTLPRPKPTSEFRPPASGLGPLGFTLVELLVVMAVIAILASIILPAVSRGKTKARSAACVGNLRQLGVALYLYVDQEQSYPLATTGDGLGHWQRVLRPIAGTKVFYCPVSRRPSPQYTSIFPTNGFIFPHYGYNCYGAMRDLSCSETNYGLGGDWIPALAPIPEGRILSPSQMIAMGDSGAFWWFGLSGPAPDPADVLWTTFPYIVPGFGRPAVGNWHSGRANMVFCDGHVEGAREAVWIKAARDRRMLWNNDNQPHLECW